MRIVPGSDLDGGFASYEMTSGCLFDHVEGNFTVFREVAGGIEEDAQGMQGFKLAEFYQPWPR